MLSLLHALRLDLDIHPPRSLRLALVGAGGKTTALFHLAREFVETPRRGVSSGRGVSTGSGISTIPAVLVTTTTHLGLDQADFADRHIIVYSPEQIDAVMDGSIEGVYLFTGAPDSQERLTGLSPELLERLRQLADERQLPLLIEADGARMLPLKAPGPHEPPIPDFVDVVVVVAGLSGLGKPLSDEWVHRPQAFASLSGLPLGQPVTAQGLVRELLHPQGGLKNIPAGARRIALLNQAGTPELQSLAGSLVENLLSSYHTVIIAHLAPLSPSLPASLAPSPLISNSYPLSPPPSPIHSAHERIAAIILAAGESQRFGSPKPLLEWRGEPFVRHCIRAAQSAGLSPLLVVGGAHTRELRQACAGFEVGLLHNSDWRAGQSTSLQVGLRQLPAETGGAVFLLADQPQVPPGLLRLLVETHAAGLPPIIAPMVDNRRANPVLFDRVTFPDLMALQGDVGGRAVFSKYALTWVPWHDRSILLDVDTPEDYQRLLNME